MTYVCCSSSVKPGEGNGWWQEINGGGANLYTSDGFLNLGTSTVKDWTLPEQIKVELVD